MRAPQLPQVIAQLRQEGRARTFGCPDPERRQVLLHGYLLALEEVERECRVGAVEADRMVDISAPRVAQTTGGRGHTYRGGEARG